MERQIMISISRCGTGNKQGKYHNMPRFQSENTQTQPSCHSCKAEKSLNLHTAVYAERKCRMQMIAYTFSQMVLFRRMQRKEKWKIARENGTVKTCPNCGKEHIQRGIYCSRECYKEHITKNPTHNVVKPLMTEKKCCVCHRLFLARQHRRGISSIAQKNAMKKIWKGIHLNTAT